MRTILSLGAAAAVSASLVQAARPQPVYNEPDPRKKNKSRSKYMPHQGKQEIARRLAKENK